MTYFHVFSRTDKGDGHLVVATLRRHLRPVHLHTGPPPQVENRADITPHASTAAMLHKARQSVSFSDFCKQKPHGTNLPCRILLCQLGNCEPPEKASAVEKRY